MVRKPVGGTTVTVKANEELISSKSFGLPDTINTIILKGFYIKNEDVKDIKVIINNGNEMLLKQGEMYDFRDLTDVVSCKVTTDAIVRFAGLM